MPPRRPPPPPPTTLKPASAALLAADLELLHVLYHRNKNQHRGTHWWQWFGTLRRHVAKLVAESERSEAATVAQRMHFLRSVVVPRAYRAFTDVVKGGRFAPLGLVLLGVLARVGGVLGYEAEEEEEEEGVEEGVEAGVEGVEGEVVEREAEAAREKWGVVVSREAYAAGLDEGGDGEEGDLMETETVLPAVPEQEPPPAEEQALDSGDETPEKKPAENVPEKAKAKGKDKKLLRTLEERPKKAKKAEDPPAKKAKRKAVEPQEDKKKKKKKRKKGSEIDDIFGGLV